MKKKERALKLKYGKVLEPLPRHKGFMSDHKFRLLLVINEGIGSLPLFKVEDITTAKINIYTHKFFKI